MNPILALCALILPGILCPEITIRKYYVEFFLGIGFVNLVMLFDNAIGILPTTGFDGSTHSAFAASVGVSLGVLWRPLWAVIALLLVSYGGLMLYQDDHSLAEIAISAAIAGVATWVLHKVIHNIPTSDARR